jgi:hypothetical protein
MRPDAASYVYDRSAAARTLTVQDHRITDRVRHRLALQLCFPEVWGSNFRLLFAVFSLCRQVLGVACVVRAGCKEHNRHVRNVLEGQETIWKT